MGLLSRAFVTTQFKLGVYQARQIMRIEKRGVVISSADAKYQPDGGIRHELSPDEWFLYSYFFFPRNHVESTYNEEFIRRELYYDAYAKKSFNQPDRNIYAIYKGGYNTGYIITEMRLAHPPEGMYASSKTRFYDAIYLNKFGMASYKTNKKSGSVKPIYFVHAPIDAAICVLSDVEDFEKTNIDLPSLKQDSEDSPGAAVLYSKLTALLSECQYISQHER